MRSFSLAEVGSRSSRRREEEFSRRAGREKCMSLEVLKGHIYNAKEMWEGNIRLPLVGIDALPWRGLHSMVLKLEIVCQYQGPTVEHVD